MSIHLSSKFIFKNIKVLSFQSGMCQYVGPLKLASSCDLNSDKQKPVLVEHCQYSLDQFLNRNQNAKHQRERVEQDRAERPVSAH